MARLTRNGFQISFRGTMPVADWKDFRRDALDKIGQLGVRLIRAAAPRGYNNLAACSAYRIINASGRKDRDGDRIDLRPRTGARVHNLYHIAEYGRGPSFAGYNKRGSVGADGRKTTGRKVLAMNIGGKTIFRPSAKGYAGTFYLTDTITGPIYNDGSTAIVEQLEDYWGRTKEVSG